MARVPRTQAQNATPIQATPAPSPLEDCVARALALEAAVHPKTIKKEFLSPCSVRGMPGVRARQVLIEHGLLKATG
jgi:hypothetical protein